MTLCLLQTPLQDQNLKPVLPFPDDSAREMAAHLTLFDWNLFSNTQQMEIIYHVFGRHKFGKIVTNLDLLLRRFIEVSSPVVSQSLHLMPTHHRSSSGSSRRSATSLI